MTETVHGLIEHYGLVAVYLGCIAEGESTAILAGFFAHQGIMVAWQAFCVAAFGAFTGDTVFFIVGRSFAERPFVVKMRAKPGFAHAYALVQKHPDIFVLTNRYIYGLRVAGAVAAGFSSIPVPRFVVLNAVSSIVWAGLFCSIGYVFGAGAEELIGHALLKHERILIGLAIGVAVAILAWLVARHFGARVVRDAAVREETR